MKIKVQQYSTDKNKHYYLPWMNPPSQLEKYRDVQGSFPLSSSILDSLHHHYCWQIDFLEFCQPGNEN